MKKRYLYLAAGLWLFVAIHTVWIAPLLLRLPALYAEETSFTATSSFRERPSGPFATSNLIARRVDQTLLSSETHSIIQGDLHWMNNAGVVEYENTGIYGVDRRTRMNLPGYGNVVRTGQFLFPLHIEQKTFMYWDPLFIGGRQATFVREDTLAGLAVYVFRFSASNLDETAGYSHLPDVPGRYEVRTDGNGTLWIEPTSGIVVYYDEQGTSRFVDRKTGKHVAYFNQWADHYTPETKAFKLNQAKRARLQILAMERWLPITMALAGLFSLAVGIAKLKSVPPRGANT